MPKYNMIMEVEACENIAFIRPAEGRQWPLKFACSACKDESPNYVFVDSEAVTENDGGGTRNSVHRCRGCKGTITVDVLPSTGAIGFYDAESQNGLLLQLDVRGGEPTDLQLDDQWVVESAEGTNFAEVDLSDDWCEFDEAGQVPVTISGVTIAFEKAKK